MRRILFILTIFLFGCGTTSKVSEPHFLVENNQDVLILALLIQNHLRQSDSTRDFNVNDLVEKDSLRRISNNFQMATLKTHGRYISVSFKYSALRNTAITLTNKEKEMLNWMRWTSKDMTGSNDGEIRFDYGERFYRIKEILLKAE